MAKLQSVNGTTGKETLYVDVDDEITAIIDKVGSAKSKVVALVLPKRCPVLQSVVNMKLLQRTADKAGKNLVLVTSEAGLMPLAGAVGMYVAVSPNSKPAIPEAPAKVDDDSEDVSEPLNVVDGNAPDTDFDSRAAGAKPVGELAAAGAAAKNADDEFDESIDMSDAGADEPAGGAAATKKAPKLKKNKKLAVPNFDAFRKRLFLGVLVLALLVVAWIYAFRILPKAAVTIGTDSSTIPTNMTLILSTSATKLDAPNEVVPAMSQTQQKTSTQTVPATGQQNNGQKATGTVTLQQQVCAPNLGQTPSTIPAGSSVSSDGNTYITQQDASYAFDSFSGGTCATYSTGSVDITALKGGTSSNTSSSGASFTGPGGASGTGSASGGTDDVVTIVQQSDITNATNKISSSDSSGVKQQLESALEAKGLQPVSATFLAGTPKVATDAKAGDQASNVTVTSVTSYTMLGVKKADLQTLVDNNVKGQLDKGKQVILDDGVANAQFSEENPGTDTSATVAMSVKSQAGPRLDTNALKTQLAGMKSGDVKNYIKQTPGVTSVQVHFSPAWVNTVPKNASKVTVNIVKAKG